MPNLLLDSQRIAVLGAGTMGRAVAGFFAGAGYRVVLGSRTAGRRADTPGGSIEVRSYRDAVASADIVFLTTLWEHTEAALHAVGPFDGRVLIDCSNPEGTDGRSLAVGLTTSGAEHVATWAPDARVVKAFNHVYAEVLSSREALARGVTVFVCGDDGNARLRVCELLQRVGLEPIDAGSLTTARYLEPLAMLMVELVRGQGFGAAELVLRADRIGRGSPPVVIDQLDDNR
jgi:predicted dinucleotide-binding enzyme